VIGGLRSRPGISLAVAALALALGAAPAPAQQAPGRPAALGGGAGAPGGHLWWNDPEVGEKLSLTVEQRARMDELYRKVQQQNEARGNPVAARDAYLAALREGDMERARTRLAAWADAEDAALRGMGTLRIEVLSLLSAEQRKALASLKPDLIGVPWNPRHAWTYLPPPKRMAPPKRPAPVR
jgi:Spy/CpxP family protein refolding chaperone